VEFDALIDSIKDVALNIINTSQTMPKEASFAIKNIDSRRGIVNFICSNFEFSDDDRQMLLEAINLAGVDQKIPLLIIRFYDEYVEEIRAHIQHEDEFAFEYHPTDDQHVAAKAIELKNLIIKYYPHNATSAQASEQERLLYAVLHDLYHFENELALHCAIEDEILLPALTRDANKSASETNRFTCKPSEELSAREIEVLVQIVKGLSNKEIADTLCLSTHTVMSHRKNIARKLDIHSTAGLTIYAIVNGIVDLDNL
jgi:regulator of cell morphogenesis and NO signaling